MIIPDTLKVGNLQFTITQLEDSEYTHYGKASMSEQKIWLSKRFSSEDKKIETFFHEVTHLLLDMGRYEKESADEKFVDCIAMGMYQVLKDNNLLQ